MSIKRLHTNDRMSQIVIAGDTVYLAGQVASKAPGESVANQTKSILEQIDKQSEKKQKMDPRSQKKA